MFDLTQLPDQFLLLVVKKMEISSHIKFFFLQTQVSQGEVGEGQSKGVRAPIVSTVHYREAIFVTPQFFRSLYLNSYEQVGVRCDQVCFSNFLKANIRIIQSVLNLKGFSAKPVIKSSVVTPET